MDLSPGALYRSLCSDLASRIGQEHVEFLRDHDLYPDATPDQAAAHSILKSFLKKYEKPNSQEQDRKALEKFLVVNERCRTWSLQLANSFEEVLYGEFRRAVFEFFGGNRPSVFPDNHLSIADLGRCGPGASVGARGNDSYSKLFSSPLSCTSRTLYEWYRRYVSNYPEWSQAEVFRSDNLGQVLVVRGNRLSFVPKDDKVSRTICTEPNLNMFFQLGLGAAFERRLRSYLGIDMGLQPLKNRELALEGSVNGSYVTIDLASASDSMSLKMLELCIPARVMTLLKMYRSPVSVTPRGDEQELYMVSTMGNGSTFPLQTIIFSCVVRAAFEARGFKPHNPYRAELGNWGVFGDDIVVPVVIYRDVMALLRILGFVANPDKTFAEGPFRESCGGDYRNGRNIRGVYLKRIDTVTARLAAINQLNLFSAKTGIPLRETVRALVRTVPWVPVPFAENDTSGIKVPRSMAEDLPYCPHYQSTLYSRYEAVGVKIRIKDRGIKVPRGSKPLVYNPSGLLVSFVAGWISSSAIGVRHDPVKWRRRRVSSSNWDYFPTVCSGNTEQVNWQRWNTAVYLNLYG